MILKLAALLLLALSCQAQELLRPTAEMNIMSGLGCVGFNQASGNMPLAYDAAGLTTSSSQSASGTTSVSHFKARAFITWAPTSNTYSALTLNVNTASAGSTGSDGLAEIDYSINSGTSWTAIRSSGGGWSQTTDVVTLSAAQDLTKLRVAICVEGDRDPTVPGSDSIQVFDIWTLGTTAAPTPGIGSGAGLPGRSIIIIADLARREDLWA